MEMTSSGAAPQHRQPLLVSGSCMPVLMTTHVFLQHAVYHQLPFPSLHSFLSY